MEIRHNHGNVIKTLIQRVGLTQKESHLWTSQELRQVKAKKSHWTI